jgi:peptidoglycan/LPS O-acetylase OafA/YrhL
LIVPAIVLFAARYGWRAMFITITVVAAIAVTAYGIMGATGAESLPWKLFGVTFVPYLWWFTIGIAWARFWPRMVQSGWLAAASILLYFALDKLPLDTGPAFIASAAAAIPLSYAVIWFGYNGPKALGRLTTRVGDLSFSVYIWHMIVVNLLVTWGGRSWAVDGTLLVTAVIVATTFVAFASWHLVEKPALNRKKYTSAHPSATAASAFRPGDPSSSTQTR